MQSAIATRVAEFLARELHVKSGRLESGTRLRQDLNVDGADAIELLDKFAEEFDVDMSGCDLTQYFGPEGWDPVRWLWRLVVDRNALPMTIADLARSAESGRWMRSIGECSIRGSVERSDPRCYGSRRGWTGGGAV